MSALMEVTSLFSQEVFPPPISFMQDDSFSRPQVTANDSEHPEALGLFLGRSQETYSRTSTADELNSRFVITTNRRETFKFIETNDLLPILLKSEKYVSDAFGQASLKTLAIVQDDEGYRTLFCLVVFGGTLAEAQEALRSFDRDWWLRNSRKFGSKLNFDFELV